MEVTFDTITGLIYLDLTWQMKTGTVFMKGLSQVLGLSFVQKYSQLKPQTWLRPFVNMALVHTSSLRFCTVNYRVQVSNYQLSHTWSGPGFKPLERRVFYPFQNRALNKH